MPRSDTVFALATAPGRAALSVIRISGPAVTTVARILTRRETPPARVASLRALFDPATGEKIDQALVTLFSAPNSFTGEDSLELSIHGARSVVSALARCLSALPGVRPAEPGEFTRRAFLNGKLDLAQAEAIADLIDSETEFQRRQALRLLDGSLGRKAAHWRDLIVGVLAELESWLDFSDEGDVHSAAHADVLHACKTLEADLAAELASSGRAAVLRDGFTVVIAGPPNAGKSTLFNTLIGREAAIVTDVPGTTRDLLEARLDLCGAPVTLVDTAGLRCSDDPVERIGVERARSAARSANLVLHLVSADTEGQDDDLVTVGDFDCLKVWSKCDQSSAPAGMLAVSVAEPATIDRLCDEISRRALGQVGDGSEGELIRTRHVSAAMSCLESVKRARRNIECDLPELAAEECRAALKDLELLSGATTTEDILGEIFAKFCIGK
jgi:tRNA modification GTPase